MNFKMLIISSILFFVQVNASAIELERKALFDITDNQTVDGIYKESLITSNGNILSIDGKVTGSINDFCEFDLPFHPPYNTKVNGDQLVCFNKSEVKVFSLIDNSLQLTLPVKRFLPEHPAQFKLARIEDNILYMALIEDERMNNWFFSFDIDELKIKNSSRLSYDVRYYIDDLLITEDRLYLTANPTVGRIIIFNKSDLTRLGAVFMPTYTGQVQIANNHILAIPRYSEDRLFAFDLGTKPHRANLLQFGLINNFSAADNDYVYLTKSLKTTGSELLLVSKKDLKVHKIYPVDLVNDTTKATKAMVASDKYIAITENISDKGENMVLVFEKH